MSFLINGKEYDLDSVGQLAKDVDQLTKQNTDLQSRIASLIKDPPPDIQERVIQMLNLVSADAVSNVEMERGELLQKLKASNAAWVESVRERGELRIELERVKHDRNRQGVIARSEALKISEGFKAERDELLARIERAKTTESELLAEREELKAKLEKSKACAAEMRIALVHSYSWLGCEECGPDSYCQKCLDQDAVVTHALSTSCGQPLLAHVKRLEEALGKTRMALKEVTRTPHNPARWMDFVQQALETEEK